MTVHDLRDRIALRDLTAASDNCLDDLIAVPGCLGGFRSLPEMAGGAEPAQSAPNMRATTIRPTHFLHRRTTCCGPDGLFINSEATGLPIFNAAVISP